MPDRSMRTEGDIVDGRYRIVRVLGSGGFATTYEALDLCDGARAVALKEAALREACGWKAVELFEREARTLARIEHRAIPRYVEHFVVDGGGDARMVLVQELAVGPSLARKVADGWRADEAQTIRLAREALDALAYLHGRAPPLVHRDIKPANVIALDDGKLALVDFGAVRDAWPRESAVASTVVGTFGYMAPEQYRGQATPQSDLYALGCTLVFALTGRSPTELPQRRLQVEFRPFTQVSRRFAAWIDRMVAPALEDRFASAQQAMHALNRVGAHGWTPGAVSLMAAPLVLTAVATTMSGSPEQRARSKDWTDTPTRTPPPAGAIRLNGTQPGVTLFIDDREIGPLPQEVGGLAAGDHRVKIAASDRYESVAKHVTVTGGTLEDLGTITLRVLRGKATISAGTAGARVELVQGSSRRRLPLLPISIELDATRPWFIQATKAGYHDYVQRVDFGDGLAEKAYVVTLERDGGEGDSLGCNPPYTADDKGHIHFKPACVH